MSELCFWSTKDVVLKLLPNVYVLLTKQSLKLQTGSVLLLCVSGSEQGCCANGLNRFFLLLIPKSQFYHDGCFLCASGQNIEFRMVSMWLRFWSQNAACPNVFVNVCCRCQRKPHGQIGLNCLLCALIRQKRHVQNASWGFWFFWSNESAMLKWCRCSLCVSDPERDCCANGIFLTVFDPKHFACPHAFCILGFWKNTLFSNGFCFVELLIPINIIRTMSQMRVFLTKGFTLKWSQLIKKKLHA